MISKQEIKKKERKKNSKLLPASLVPNYADKLCVSILRLMIELTMCVDTKACYR